MTRSLLDDFREALLRMGGKFAPKESGEDFGEFIRSLFPQARVICSATVEVRGTRGLARNTNPTDFADVDVGIVRAAFGVAETGSIWLSEAELQVNALAYLAQHFVVLLDPSRILGNLHEAYRDPAVQDGALRRVGDGSFRDRRHRGCLDPRSAGRPQLDSGADGLPGRRRGSKPRITARMLLC